MLKINVNEQTFIKHCDFIKQYTKLTTRSKIVREAVKVYADNLKAEKKQALLNRLKELEK